MEYISRLIDFIRKIFVWWVVIVPWEMGIRVRGGKRTKTLSPGFHFRIPLYDQIYAQDVRLRVISLPPQTVTTNDNKTITLVVAIGYSITDILKLFQTLYQAESTISTIVQGKISQFVVGHSREECLPISIEDNTLSKLQGLDYGISFEYLKITGFAEVRTYRLISDQHWTPNSLDTSTHR